MNRIYCCGCGHPVTARLTDGAEIYPHREDLHSLPFWKCDECGNYVGCAHKTSTPTRPLGCIPTPEIKEKRKQIHALLDPLWRNKILSRSAIYTELSKQLGREYHTAELRTETEADKVIQILMKMTRITS